MSTSSPTEWTLARVNQMIVDQVEESLNLDYKRAAALDRGKAVEITKDVSSFANSSGGVLIYGVSEDSTHKHLPGALDPVSRTEISKEWLEATILTIQPRIEEVRIFPVAVNVDRVIYVVEVDQSSTAHQARDHKYYRRWEFSSRPMEDYEVRDVMNRSKHPRIELVFRMERFISKDPMGIPAFGRQPEEALSLHVYGLNCGAVMGHHVAASVSLPTLLLDKYEVVRSGVIKKGKPIPDLTLKWLDNQKQDRGPMGNVLSDVRYEPILPGLDLYLGTFSLDLKVLKEKNQDAPLIWRVHCDNAPPVEGEVRLGSIPLDDERDN